VFVCVWDHDRKSQRNCKRITYLGNVRHFCVWRWPGTFAFAECVAHRVWMKRQEIEVAWEEVGKRRRFGSLSKRLIIASAANAARIPSV